MNFQILGFEMEYSLRRDDIILFDLTLVYLLILLCTLSLKTVPGFSLGVLEIPHHKDIRWVIFHSFFCQYRCAKINFCYIVPICIKACTRINYYMYCNCMHALFNHKHLTKQLCTQVKL